jgi:hypothetical protein
MHLIRQRRLSRFRRGRHGTWLGRRRRTTAFVALAVLAIAGQSAAARAGAVPAASPSPAPDRLANPDAVLAPGWQRSADRAVAVAGDATGLHILVAEAARGYAWRTAATLAGRGTETTQWIGQACVTGDGGRAVVVYAPRDVTSHPDALGDGAAAAVVDLASGRVTPIGVGVSIAYFNPGCGTGDQVVLTQGGTGAGATAVLADSTHLMTVDAMTGKITAEVTVPGQVTSAVPYAGGIAAAAGAGVSSIDARGTVRTLATTSGTPLRLAPDSSGGLGFEVVAGRQEQVHRFAAGRDSLVGTAAIGSARLSQTAGRLFVTGPEAGDLGRLPASWQAINAPAESTVSTTGALAVTADTPLDASARSPLTAAPDVAQPVRITARVTATAERAAFAVPATSAAPFDTVPAPLPGYPVAPRRPGVVPSASGASTSTVDPDRRCSVPRNDPHLQTYQPSMAEEEWAVDQAVRGQLTGTRGPNLYQSGLPAYSPQGMFPALGLSGGGTVPAQVVFGILAQESAEYQASNHAIIGQTGNVMPSSNWYGDFGSYTYVDFTHSDCGYGAGQITDGMCLASYPGCTGALPWNSQVAVTIDYEANIAASVRIIQQKWNELRAAGIIANGGQSQYLVNWYLALWDYNSGLHADDGAGNSGLGWVNNPINPNYPADRESYLSSNYNYDVSHPSQWPYQEKVLGYADYGLYRWSFVDQLTESAFKTASFGGPPNLPARTAFCTSGNHCNAGAAPNPCQLGGSLEDHCWWHTPITWAQACAASCGTENLTYPPGAAPPGYPGLPPHYAANCSAPVGVIVDDVSADAPAARGECPTGYVNNGSMTWSFPAAANPSGVTTYPAKIDLHQIGAGYGAHFWFSHSIDHSDASTPFVITGTWTPPSSVTGWTEIQVHLPNAGAWEPQADYQIFTGTGSPAQHRIVNQDANANTWVRLGVFNLSAGAHLSLSNATAQGLDRDIAWDAAAFIHRASPPSTNYVAMGDSYSSGEGLQPYDPTSDNSDDACHRSMIAYPRQVTLPGQTTPIAQQAAGSGSSATFSFIACSGVVTTGVSTTAVNSPPNAEDAAGSTPWGSVDYHFGEVPQVDQGYLAPDTTLVTLSVGGNDARFADVLAGCLLTVTDCTAPNYVLQRHSNGVVDPQPLATFEPHVLSELQSHLVSVYSDVHRSAPNAEVVVVGYPHLFPADTANLSCPVGLGLSFSPADQTWMNQMGDQLNASVQRAVNAVKSQGVDIHFVNPVAGFTGHDVCSGGNAWINGLLAWSTSGAGLKMPGSGSFHPKSAGQQEYARQVDACLADTTIC